MLLTEATVPSGHEIISAKSSNSINLRNLPAATARELGHYFLHLVHLGSLVSCPLLLLFIRGSLALHRAEQLILCSRNQQNQQPRCAAAVAFYTPETEQERSEILKPPVKHSAGSFSSRGEGFKAKPREPQQRLLF